MYSAASRIDLEYFASQMRKAGNVTKTNIVVLVIIKKLMFPPWWLRLMLGGLRLIRGEKGVVLMLWMLSAKNPEIIETMYSQTIDHMLTGKDREERTSVGGFSQRELDMVVEAFTKSNS
jgi:hypothetical protein